MRNRGVDSQVVVMRVDNKRIVMNFVTSNVILFE